MPVCLCVCVSVCGSTLFYIINSGGVEGTQVSLPASLSLSPSLPPSLCPASLSLSLLTSLSLSLSLSLSISFSAVKAWIAQKASSQHLSRIGSSHFVPPL